MKTVSQILQEGKARIEAGWVQGGMYRDDPSGSRSYCAVGAIWFNNTLTDVAVLQSCLRVLEQALPRKRRNDPWLLIEYNDAAGRTQADILALYDRALTEVTK